MTDIFLFAAFPYMAVILAVVISIYRYVREPFSYSSLSSQFLENKLLFWASISWHYGIVLILLAHLLAALFPTWWGMLLAEPWRLYLLEVTGWGLGLMSVVGGGLFIVRRIITPRVRVVTSKMDWVVLVLLLAQVILGLWTALFYRWGAVWYLHTAVPWLWSLVYLQPDVSYVANLPWVIQWHFLGGFVLVLIFPFTRLVHMLPYPITYLWRPFQVVVWNRRANR